MKIIKFLPFYLLSLLPLFILHFFADVFSLIIFRILKYRKKVIFDNIIGSFPEKDNTEIQKIERKFYRHFCDIFIEAVKVLTISKAAMIKRYHFTNPEITDKYYKKGKSIILYMGHYGNWEWSPSQQLLNSHQSLAFYQEQTNGYFDQLIKLIRERFGNICIESKKGYKILSEYNNNKQAVITIMLGDQSPPKGSAKVWVDFLNRETAFLTGAERIAKRLDHVLMFPKIKKDKRGFYELEFIEIDPDHTSENIIAKYAKLLENNIKLQPELWLWSHRRWKLKKEDN